jgi:hypothetical protein
MSRIRANLITNQSADGAPTVQNGLVVSGITTSTINGNVVGTGVSVVGVITATSFVGSGANLTGLASREFYGFKAVNEDLILVHTNNGADNISLSDFESFEDTMTAPSGLSFSINSAGELEMTV